MNASIKKPDVAAAFYSNRSEILRRDLASFMESKDTIIPGIRGVIAPHAGYAYSGPIAGTAYAALRASQTNARTLVILSPAHRCAFRGMAIPSYSHFETPLGRLEVDRERRSFIQTMECVVELDEAFEHEHAIEVQLPFIQVALPAVRILPMVVSGTTPQEVADVLAGVWTEDAMLVVSSDLSHFHHYEKAQLLDATTAEIIKEKRLNDLHENDACGFFPLQGALLECVRRSYSVQCLDLRNSGDISGEKSRVVGYGAFALSAL